MIPRFALFVGVALQACAPIRGYQEVDSSRKLFRLHVGETARVDLASIEEETGVQVWRPEKMIAADIMGMNPSIIESFINDADRNQVFVIRFEKRGAEDCCVIRMEGGLDQATVVKFIK